MVFLDDSGVKEGDKETNDTNTPGSLIVKLLNEHTTRQGTIYEVINKRNEISYLKLTPWIPK